MFIHRLTSLSACRGERGGGVEHELRAEGLIIIILLLLIILVLIVFIIRKTYLPGLPPVEGVGVVRLRAQAPASGAGRAVLRSVF